MLRILCELITGIMPTISGRRYSVACYPAFAPDSRHAVWPRCENRDARVPHVRPVFVFADGVRSAAAPRHFIKLRANVGLLNFMGAAPFGVKDAGIEVSVVADLYFI